jgi:hypothetical protein
MSSDSPPTAPQPSSETGSTRDSAKEKFPMLCWTQLLRECEMLQPSPDGLSEEDLLPCSKLFELELASSDTVTESSKTAENLQVGLPDGPRDRL